MEEFKEPEQWLRFVANGSKTFEARLNQNAWSKLRIGDEFVLISGIYQCILKIISIRNFLSFYDAAAKITLIPTDDTVKKIAEEHLKNYSISSEDEKSAGVLVIEFILVSMNLALLKITPPPVRLTRNSTSFMHMVTTRLRYAYTYGLFPHQARTLKYATDPSCYSGNISVDPRGLLIADEMGTGKGVMMAALAHKLNMPTILLTTKTLITEFRRGAATYERVTGEKICWDYFRTVSLNASNTILQLAQAIDGVTMPFLADTRTTNRDAAISAATSIEERKEIRSRYSAAAALMSLNGILILIDEAHLLTRAVSNGSANATAIYRAIQNSPKARVFLFTGTPAVDDPFELGLLFNMVGPANAPPFSENYTEFERHFVNREKGIPSNPNKWMNRISGLQTLHRADSQELPQLLPRLSHYIPMDSLQYEEYAKAREQEFENNKKNIGSKQNTSALLQRPRNSKSSTYRVHSRQAGNSYWSEDQLLSPKADWVIKHASSAKRMVLVYTQFVQRGTNSIIAAAERAGWSQLSTDADPPPDKNKLFYAALHGDVPVHKQNAIIATANDVANANGGKLRLIIVSVIASVGLNFYWGSDVIIFEPYWNDALHEQIIARIRRSNSLPGVPFAERTIQPHILFAVPPKKFSISKKSTYADTFGEATDIALYSNAIKSATLLQQFRNLGARASINAVLENYQEARLCQPTGVPLFSNGLDADVASPDPCSIYKKITIDATPIIIDDIEYFYATSTQSLFGIELFRKNTENSKSEFISVLENDPAFQKFFTMRANT